MLYYARDKVDVARITGWIRAMINDGGRYKEDAYAVAVVGKNGLNEIYAAMAFFDYSGTDVFVEGAIDKPSVCRMNDFEDAIGVPFRNPLNVLRVTALVKSANKRSFNILTKLGFKKEGEIRNYLQEGCNGFVLGLTRQDWEDRYGKQRWRRKRPATSDTGRNVCGASGIQ